MENKALAIAMMVTIAIITILSIILLVSILINAGGTVGLIAAPFSAILLLYLLFKVLRGMYNLYLKGK